MSGGYIDPSLLSPSKLRPAGVPSVSSIPSGIIMVHPSPNRHMNDHNHLQPSQPRSILAAQQTMYAQAPFSSSSLRDSDEHKSARNPRPIIAAPLISLSSHGSSLTAEAEEARRKRKLEADDAAFARRLAQKDRDGDLFDDDSEDDRKSQQRAATKKKSSGKRKKEEESEEEYSDGEEEEEIGSRGAKRRKGEVTRLPARDTPSSRARRDLKAAADARARHVSNAPPATVTRPETIDVDAEMVDANPPAVPAAAHASIPRPSPAAAASSSSSGISSGFSSSGISATLAAAYAAHSAPHVGISPRVPELLAELTSLVDEQKLRVKHKREEVRIKEASKQKALTLAQQVQLYKFDQPDCGAASAGKKQCKGSPNCLHGILYKSKLGIWAAHPSALKSLGVDPAARQRDGVITHAGLKNLGATCYMNTLFQCLFMNAHFRRGIYKFRTESQRGGPLALESAATPNTTTAVAQDVEMKTETTDSTQPTDMEVDTPSAAAVLPSPPALISTPSEIQAAKVDAAAKDRIVSELQNLFARLEFGQAAYEDPHRIVSSLGLKPGEQQDINEFNNLFLQVLDSRLKLCTNEPGVATLIDDEFKGTIVHTIQCQKCNTRRENQTSFYDLTLQIAKFKNVPECLIRHMQKEHLTGANKYRCGSCQSQQDASRSTVLKELPPVLNLQLLRFGYDPLKDAKKKLQDNIAIPATLDLTPFTSEDAIDQLSAELDCLAADPKGAASSAAGVLSPNSSHPPVSPSRRTHPDAMEIDQQPILPLAGSSPARPKMARGGGQASPRAAPASSSVSPYQYELTAILRHKGASAYHGHYIADIRDPEDHSRWWRFDDDSCKPLLQFDDGAGFGGDSATKSTDSKKPKKSKAKGKGKPGAKKKSAADDDDADEYEDGGKSRGKSSAVKVVESESEVSSDDEPEVIDLDPEVVVIDDEPSQRKPISLENLSSRNAYMLVYSRVGRPRVHAFGREMLTPEMEDQVRESDQLLKKQIEEYKQKKDAMLKAIEVRKMKVSKVLELLETFHPLDTRLSDANLSGEMSANFGVPGSWLRRWTLGISKEEEESNAKYRTTASGPVETMDLTDEPVGPNGEVSPAVLERIAAIEKETAAAREFERTGVVPTAASTPPDPSSTPVNDDASSATPAPASSSASAVPPSSTPFPSTRRPTIRHPLWPGDLRASLTRLLCEHGKAIPQDDDMKRVSEEMWQIMIEDNDQQKAQLLSHLVEGASAPVVAPISLSKVNLLDDLCDACCRDLALEQSFDSHIFQCRDELLELIRDLKTAYGWGVGEEKEDAYYVSKSFLKKWFDKQGKEYLAGKCAFADLDTTANVDISAPLLCKHRLFTPEEKDRYLVPKRVWERLTYIYPSSTPLQRHVVVDCPECMRAAASASTKQDVCMARVAHDLRVLGKTAPWTKFPSLHRPPIALTGPGAHYVLLPGMWARHYAQHLDGTAKDLPPLLNPRVLLCQHDKLLYNPIPADWAPVRPLPSPYSAPGTPEGTYLALAKYTFWANLVKDGAYFHDLSTDALEVKMFVHERPDALQLHDLTDWNRYDIRTEPPPCEECILARIHREQEHHAAWGPCDINVHVMEPGEPLPAAVSAPSPASSAAARPKRAATRKVKTGAQTYQIENFNSTDTLLKAKLTIYQYSDVPPGQQLVHCNGRKLDGDKKSLGQHGVDWNSELWVTRDLDGDADTSAYFDDEPRKGRVAAPEAGFAGTALSSAPRSKKTKEATEAARGDAIEIDAVTEKQWECAASVQVTSRTPPPL